MPRACARLPRRRTCPARCARWGSPIQAPEQALEVRTMIPPRILSTTALSLALGAAALFAAPAAHAAEVDCKLTFEMSGWSVFYKTASGHGTVTCDNGQSMRVKVSTKGGDRKSTRLNSSHVKISYAVFCLKKKTTTGPGAGITATSAR